MADYSRKINGVNYWVITKLDVLSDFKEIFICTGYKYNNKFLLSYPATVNVLEGVEPVYKSFEGWQCDISKCTTWDELPKEAKNYLKFIEEFTSTPIAIVSVGAERNQNIILKDVWKD